MSLAMEKDLQLRVAVDAVADCSTEELRTALIYSWTILLKERQQSAALVSDLLGMDVLVGGPLLPPTLRASVC
jgi:hypothetical protein